MSSRREVLIRILALLQRKKLIETKKSHIRKLKMALFDCAINEKKKLHCWRRTTHLPSLFRPHPGRFDSSRVPTPGNLPSKTKKKCYCPGISPGRGGWAQVELTPYETTRAAATAASKGLVRKTTSLYITNFYTFLYRPSTTTTWNDHILIFFLRTETARR